MNAFNEAASMSVFCKDHPLAVFRQRLAAAGIVRAGDLRRIRSNSRVRVTGVLVIVHTPPTRSGKRVMFITIEDETGIMDLVMFPNAAEKMGKAHAHQRSSNRGRETPTNGQGRPVNIYCRGESDSPVDGTVIGFKKPPGRNLKLIEPNPSVQF